MVTKTNNRMIDGSVVNVRDFGAVGDGVADDTAAVQAALESTGNNWETVTGEGIFSVTTVRPKQRTVLKNLRLKSLGSAAQTFTQPVVEIGNNVDLLDGLLIDNVHIDGNRGGYSNILLTPPQGGDGGMHGFHIKGQVRNVTIKDSSANFCATAGLALDWDTDRPVADSLATYGIRDINIVRCDFNWNREHGSFAAYCQRVKFIECNMMNNGRNVVDGLAESHGNSGAFTQATGFFGRGIDIESYNQTSVYTEVEIRGGNYTNNANGSIQFFDPASPGGNRRSAAHIVVKNVLTGPPLVGTGRTFNVQTSNPTGDTHGINTMLIQDITLQGQMRINGVNGLTITGKQLGTTEPDNSIDISNSRGLSTDISVTSEMTTNIIETPTVAVTQGTATIALEPPANFSPPTGGITRATYRFRVSGASVADEKIIATFTFSDSLPLHVARDPYLTSQQVGNFDFDKLLTVAWVGGVEPRDVVTASFESPNPGSASTFIYLTVNVAT